MAGCMRARSRLVLFAILGCLAAGAVTHAAAQAPAPPRAAPPGSPSQPPVDPQDRASIASCLRESGRAATACIGSVAVVCARQASPPNADTSIACSRRELAVWRERMDAAALAYGRSLAAAQRSRFLAVQRAWEGYSALKCSFLAEMQAPARAGMMLSGCELRETAERAIDIERLARRQTQEGADRRAPPQLFR